MELQEFLDYVNSGKTIGGESEEIQYSNVIPTAERIFMSEKMYISIPAARCRIRAASISGMVCFHLMRKQTYKMVLSVTWSKSALYRSFSEARQAR